jgi:phage gpG-like protein
MGILSLLEGAALFAEIAVEMNHIEHHCLDEGSKILQDEAKRVIGTYDYGWPQLAASTQRQREYQGFEPNEPLLRTGDMRDSIEREVQPGVAYVGSNNDKVLWQEFGTSRIPPRSFLGGAAEAKHEEIGELIGKKHHDKLISKA